MGTYGLARGTLVPQRSTLKPSERADDECARPMSAACTAARFLREHWHLSLHVSY